jgi:hypothetical protein
MPMTEPAPTPKENKPSPVLPTISPTMPATVPQIVVPELVTPVANPAALIKALDEVGEQFDKAASSSTVSPMVVAQAATVASAGYVLWNLRSLYFLSSLLTGTPLIRRFDPLSVLSAWEERDDEDESLQSMIERLPKG